MVRSLKRLAAAGFIGAVAGVFIMSRLDARIERRVRYRGKAFMRDAKWQAGRLGHLYHRGRSVLQERVHSIR